MYERKLILDTCALLWLASGDKALSPAARDAIEHASIVYISPITAWEISLKTVRGALELPMEPEKWFSLALENHNLSLASLDVPVLVAANRLPWHHRDPADRFIIATALKEKAAVVTADERFQKYDVDVII